MEKIEITKDGAVELMERLCREHHVKLTFLKADEGRGGFNYGGSTDEEIMLAPFVMANAGDRLDGHEIVRTCRNPVECMLAAFFHEFAHVKLEGAIPHKVEGYAWNCTSKYQFELWVSMLGFEHAMSCGLRFSDETVKWMLDENASYMRDDPESLAMNAVDVRDAGYTLVRNDWYEKEVTKKEGKDGKQA